MPIERRVEVGLVEDLPLPLLDGRRAGGEDQGLGLEGPHRRQADDRLAGAAGQDDHARTASNVAAGVKRRDGPLLIVADAKRQAGTGRLANPDRQRGTGGVARQVFGRVADRDQGLLQNPAIDVVDGEAGLVDPFAQIVAHAPLPRQLFEQRAVLGDQPKLPVDARQPDPAVTAHQLAQVGRHVGGQRKLREPLECLDHRVRRHAGGRRVPERERRQTIGVNVLRALLQLGERRDRVAGLGVQRVVNLQQDRAVSLHDQRIGGIVLHGLLAGSGQTRGRRIPDSGRPHAPSANVPS